LRRGLMNPVETPAPSRAEMVQWQSCETTPVRCS
jgi:hypothetical protein